MSFRYISCSNNIWGFNLKVVGVLNNTKYFSKIQHNKFYIQYRSQFSCNTAFKEILRRQKLVFKSSVFKINKLHIHSFSQPS